MKRNTKSVWYPNHRDKRWAQEVDSREKEGEWKKGEEEKEGEEEKVVKVGEIVDEINYVYLYCTGTKNLY